jgi:hypothetical protein
MAAVGCRDHAEVENPQPTGGRAKPLATGEPARQPELRKLRSEQELEMAQTSKPRPPGNRLKAPGLKPPGFKSWVSNPGFQILEWVPVSGPVPASP